MQGMQQTFENVKQGLGLQSNLSGIDVTKLHEIRDSIKADPIKAKVKYHVDCIAETNCKVRAEISRFEIGNETFKHSKTFTEYADLPKQTLGSDSAPNPAEHLLVALGSCLTLCFLRCAACEQLNIGNVNVKLKAKIDLRSEFSDEFPNVQQGFKAICVKFDVQSGQGEQQLNREKVREIVKKAERNSIVTQALKKGLNLCVCLKGEGKEFERQFGLEASEAERSQQQQPSLGEKARQLYEQGKEQVESSLGVGGQSATGASRSYAPGAREGQQGQYESQLPVGSEMKGAGQLRSGQEIKQEPQLSQQEKYKEKQSVGPAGKVGDIGAAAATAGVGESISKPKAETTR